MYLGFGFAYTEGGPWSDDGIKAISRFISRVERLVDSAVAAGKPGGGKVPGSEERN